MQVQTVLLVVKTDTQSELWHYFSYISDSFHGNKNRGMGASQRDLHKVCCEAERNMALFLLHINSCRQRELRRPDPDMPTLCVHGIHRATG